jgi:hypothetical protein
VNSFRSRERQLVNRRTSDLGFDGHQGTPGSIKSVPEQLDDVACRSAAASLGCPSRQQLQKDTRSALNHFGITPELILRPTPSNLLQSRKDSCGQSRSPSMLLAYLQIGLPIPGKGSHHSCGETPLFGRSRPSGAFRTIRADKRPSMVIFSTY